MSEMTTAERRGYQQICGPNGAMMVIACDQRGGMRTLLSSDPAVQKTIGTETLGDTKADITQYLASHASCVLVDPACAVPRIVDDGILPRDVGLLIGLDDSGYDVAAVGGYRISKLVPGISARRVRELGGTGGKIMVYLRSDIPAANLENVATLKAVIADFAAEDMLLVVEFLTYKVDGEEEADYKAKTAELVEGGARICLGCGAKVLKLPYPGSAEACANVTAICGSVPWAVLSAGVDHSTFLEQVDVAMGNGASGVIAGRSLWKDCISLDRAAQKSKLSSVAVSRLHELQAVVDQHVKRRARAA
jgi:tagatose 1,6-diphosphate aldolase